MNDILIYSDPHIGLSRKAHFTPTSSKLREEHVRKVLKGLLCPGLWAFCLGDFFDKESNPESVILDALPIAQQTEVIMAGNHDVPNRAGAASSLAVIDEIECGKVCFEPTWRELGRSKFFFAPHQITQGRYDGSIEYLRQEASSFDGYRILCLHCSYNSPFDLPESSLNLTEAQAIDLFSTFHYILIGHEHRMADHFDGRLKIVGSVYPTAFDELDVTHRVLEYDIHQGTFRDRIIEVLSWSSEASLVKPGMHYYDLIDDLEPGLTQKLAVKLFQDGAFGVRIRPRAVGEVEKPEFRKLRSLPEAILEDLQQQSPGLVELWKEFSL